MSSLWKFFSTCFKQLKHLPSLIFNLWFGADICSKKKESVVSCQKVVSSCQKITQSFSYINLKLTKKQFTGLAAWDVFLEFYVAKIIENFVSFWTAWLTFVTCMNLTKKTVRIILGNLSKMDLIFIMLF